MARLVLTLILVVAAAIVSGSGHQALAFPSNAPTSHRVVILVAGIGTYHNTKNNFDANSAISTFQFIHNKVLSQIDYRIPPVYFSYRSDGSDQYSEQDTCNALPNNGRIALKNTIRRLVDDDPLAEIDIIAHSLGGVVALSYLETYGNEPDARHVKRLITLDSPVTGARFAEMMMVDSNIKFYELLGEGIRQRGFDLLLLLGEPMFLSCKNTGGMPELGVYKDPQRKAERIAVLNDFVSLWRSRGTTVVTFSSDDDAIVPPEDALVPGASIPGLQSKLTGLGWSLKDPVDPLGHGQILQHPKALDAIQKALSFTQPVSTSQFGAIAYTSRDGKSIRLIQADGTDDRLLMQLSDSTSKITSLAWSRDGRLLAYNIYGKGSLQIFDVAKGTFREVVADTKLAPVPYVYTFMPSSNKIITSSSDDGPLGSWCDQFLTVDVDTGHAERLGKGISCHAQGVQIYPDGNSLLVATGSSPGHGSNGIEIISIASGATTKILEVPPYSSVVAGLSNDGATMAYGLMILTSVGGRTTEAESQLIVANGNGTNSRSIHRFHSDGSGYSSPSFSPDNSQIIFPNSGWITVFNRDGSNPHQLVEGSLAAWQPVAVPVANIPPLITSEATPTPKAPTEQCYEVNPAGESISIISVSPTPGTPLKAGTQVTVRAEVQYQLVVIDRAQVLMFYSILEPRTDWSKDNTIATGRGIQTHNPVYISKGSGVVVIEGTMDVPKVSSTVLTAQLNPIAPEGYRCTITMALSPDTPKYPIE